MHYSTMTKIMRLMYRGETQTWQKLINMIEISIDYLVTPADQKVATINDNDTAYTKYSSFDMESSLSMNDELEISANNQKIEQK